MLITICLLYILMRIPFWIAKPALTPFGHSPLRRAGRFAFTAAVLSRDRAAAARRPVNRAANGRAAPARPRSFQPSSPVVSEVNPSE